MTYHMDSSSQRADRAAYHAVSKNLVGKEENRKNEPFTESSSFQDWRIDQVSELMEKSELKKIRSAHGKIARSIDVLRDNGIAIPEALKAEKDRLFAVIMANDEASVLSEKRKAYRIEAAKLEIMAWLADSDKRIALKLQPKSPLATWINKGWIVADVNNPDRFIVSRYPDQAVDTDLLIDEALTEGEGEGEANA